MPVINSSHLSIETYTIKVIGEKYNDNTDSYKKGCLLSEVKSNKHSNFYEIGLLIEHLEQLYLQHHETEITLSVEVKQVDHD